MALLARMGMGYGCTAPLRWENHAGAGQKGDKFQKSLNYLNNLKIFLKTSGPLMALFRPAYVPLLARLRPVAL